MKHILFIGFVLLNISLYSQTGVVKGKVSDDTGEPLPGATVMLEGTTRGTTTDFDGLYRLENVTSGEVTLVCSFISYEPSRHVVSVMPNQEIEFNFVLSGTSMQLGEVQIVARANREAESLLLLEQKESVTVTQTIGAQELSRKGVSDAEGAVTKISGISRQEGVKNVFVRGLGDRYNITTFNGFLMPSEDPDFKNISLEFFSTEIIQSVNVSKVFSASLVGDVGGAVIDIRSKELMDDSEFEIGISSSLNSQVPGKQFVLPDGMTALGYSNASFGPKDGYQSNYSFNTTIDPLQLNSPINNGLSAVWGKRFLANHRIFLVGSTSNDFEYREGVSREITSSGATDPFRNMTYVRYQRNSSHLLMGNLELNFGTTKLLFNTLYVHAASAYSADFYGRHTETFQVAEDFNSEGLERRLQINDNTILINQLMLSGNTSDRLEYNLGVALNYIAGKEPDRRIFRFPSIGNGNVQLHIAESRNQRFNIDLTETALVPRLNLRYKLTQNAENISYIEWGYDSRISIRDFIAPIYNHDWNPSMARPSFALNDVQLDPLFNQGGLLDNKFDIVYFNDQYDVVRNMHGTYLDMVYQLGEKVTLNGGIRADYVFLKIDYEVNRGASTGSDTINEFILSPSMNIRYIVNEKNHLRLGASRTYTLPQDKEISPFVYLGFDGNENGNPDLEMSINYNLDVKWDYYISNSELFSLGGFYKYIQNPIARVDQGNSAGLRTFDNVSDHGIAAGVEAELRKRILSIGDKHRFNLGVNAAYVYSRVDLDPVWFAQNTTSTFEGATPYIVNADITYNMMSGSFAIASAFVMNYLSDKVHTIGSRGYNNLIEESALTVDFVNSIRINDSFSVSLKAMNLTNPDFNLTRVGAASDNMPEVIISSYTKGVSFSLGIEYKL